MKLLVKEHHTFLTGSMPLTSYPIAHGPCGGFPNTIFKDNKFRLKKLKPQMPIEKNDFYSIHLFI